MKEKLTLLYKYNKLILIKENNLNNNNHMLKIFVQNIRRSYVRIGNLQGNVLSKIAALLPMVSMSLILSRIFLKTIKLSFARDFMRNCTVLMAPDANLNTRKH